MNATKCVLSTAWVAAAGMIPAAWATNTNESEPNSSRSNANTVPGMVAGDTITGTSQGSEVSGGGGGGGGGGRWGERCEHR